MHVIEIESGRIGYRDLLDYVMLNGGKSAPRGRPTLDIGPTTVVMYTPEDSLPIGTGRGVSLQIAAAEALQLIGAFSDPNLLPRSFDPYKETSGRFAGRFYGAYGDRIGNQLHHVVRKLREDRDTRQAVATLWHPQLDNETGFLDYPCTVALSFRLRSDRLNMQVVMRSQDVWLGSPYDWFQFSQLQLTIARVLGAAPGTYHHVTMSTHLYESNIDDVIEGVRSGAWKSDHFIPDGIGHEFSSWADIERRARDLPYVNRIMQSLTPSEQWYRQSLADKLQLNAPGSGNGSDATNLG